MGRGRLCGKRRHGGRLLRHEKIRGRAEALPAAGEAKGEKIHARSVTLSSDRLKLIAVIDLVEGSGAAVTPVDYKRGAPRMGTEGPEAWPADRAQVCAQVLILRDNGYTCDEAVVFYDATRQRVRVAIDEELVAATIQQVADARSLAERGRIPLPLGSEREFPRLISRGIDAPPTHPALVATTYVHRPNRRLFGLFG